jgi:hypothetical protein
MPKFAVISGTTVTNVIIANNLETASLVTGQLCVEVDDATHIFIGDKFEETPTKKVK